MQIYLLAERLRVEERLLISAFGAAGHAASLITPENPGLLEADPTTIVSRLPATRETTAILGALEVRGHRVFPGADAIDYLEDRARWRRRLVMADCQLADQTLAIGEQAIIQAASERGWPAVLLPLNAGYAATPVDDPETAEAVVEHQRVLLGQRAMLVGGTHFTEDVRRLFILGDRVIATQSDATGGWSREAPTPSETALSRQVQSALAMSIGIVDIAIAGSPVITDVRPLIQFRNMNGIETEIANAIVNAVSPVAEGVT